MTPEGRQDLAAVIAKFKEMRDTSQHEMVKAGRLRMRVNTLDAAQRRGEVGALSVVIAELETLLAALPETSAQQEKEKDLATRMDRLSTSSDASRTAATDVAEGDRPITRAAINGIDSPVKPCGCGETGWCDDHRPRIFGGR